ncbi:MAG: WecB/TagA/CpsF family glycosyltransferase [Symbiobacteriaceae bacterium]|nr:WecB/TagA/CpsF family glycosyltransferase [Symbiobacteriaceae bacterium]
MSPPLYDYQLKRRGSILGLPLDGLNIHEIIDILDMSLQKRRAVALSGDGAISENELSHIVTLNPEIAWAAYNDPLLFRAVCSAELVIPDGIGVYLAAKLRGEQIPQRVTGFDLMQRLLELAAIKGYRVFLLGASPGVAEEAATAALQRLPSLQIVGTADGYFREIDEPDLLERIASLDVDMLFCALGAPRPAEPWIYRNRENLPVGLAMGVGGSFNVMAGRIRRAPRWMQRAGLEWLFRVILEPRRLLRIAVFPRFVLTALTYKENDQTEY